MSAEKKDDEKKKKVKYPRSRVMWFCTNVYALDGTPILTPDDAIRICQAHENSLDRYAVAKHDKDVHTEDSLSERESHSKQTYMETYKKLAEERGVPKDAASESGYAYNPACELEAHKWSDFYYPKKQLGDLKELHIHVVLKFKNARAIDEIARWFGIPINMIDIVKGRNGFEDCAKYLVHAKQPEKFQYDASSVFASFDYVSWLDDQIVKDTLHHKYHMHIDDINDIVNDVAVNGLSLRDVEDMISAPIFLRNKKLFKDARSKYIYEHLQMPPCRFVFYVDGDGVSGAGKSIATKALCKQFAREYGADPTKDIGQLQDYIYKVGQKGVAWDKYDGQPIAFVDDRTAFDMLQEFGGHEGVKNLLEQFPEKESTNIKFGDTCIVCKYIIINGIQPFSEFLNGLNGTYITKGGVEVQSDKDVTQYARRITGIINITEETVAALFNKGVMQNTREYRQYISVMTRKYDFVKAVKTLSGNALFTVEEKALRPVVETSQQIADSVSNKITDADEIPAEFLDYGLEVDSDVKEISVLTPAEKRALENAKSKPTEPQENEKEKVALVGYWLDKNDEPRLGNPYAFE